VVGYFRAVPLEAALIGDSFSPTDWAPETQSAVAEVCSARLFTAAVLLYRYERSNVQPISDFYAGKTIN
jgi:hypothetical protein